MERTVETEKIQDVRLEQQGAISFQIQCYGAKHPVRLAGDDAAGKLRELQKGKRICATFRHDGMELNIWKQPKQRYRLDYQTDDAVSLCITVSATEMDKLFQIIG